eukprot:scaffold19205_cov38-Attheya_sp.AAC.2
MAHQPWEEGKHRKTLKKLNELNELKVGKSEKQLKVATEEWGCYGGSELEDSELKLGEDDTDFYESQDSSSFQHDSGKTAVFYTFLTAEEESACVEQLMDRCNKPDIWGTDETDTPVTPTRN